MWWQILIIFSYGGFSFGLKNPLSTLNYTAITSIFNHFLNLSGDFPDKQNTIEMLNRFQTRIKNADMFNNVKIWFNNKGWAASMAYMNAINNILLRAHLKSDVNKRYYGISVINHPMNFTQDQFQDELMKRGGLSLLHAVCVIFAMSFVPASFVLFLIEDRVTGSKHLQFISGVSKWIYWTSTYVWDMVSIIILW